MADIKHSPGGIPGLRNAYYHDEGDGTHTEAFTAHMRGWDLNNLIWSKVRVNGTTGALLVEATLSTGDIQIGAVELKNATTDDRAIVSAAGAVKVDGSAVTQPVSGTVTASGPLTDTQLRATAVPVSGPATDAQLRATPLPVSGTVTASGPLTDAQLRAAAVPVSGPLTDAQIRAAALPVSGTVTANAGSGPFPVSDNAGSLTVDAPVGTPVFVRLSDGSAAIATLPVSLAAAVALDAATLAALETVTANPTTGEGKTLLFATISQGAAGTTSLVAADAAAKIKVVSYVVVLDAAGSFKFTDGVADLSGVMPVAANGGVSAIGQPSAHLLETGAVNRALSITTVTGKAFGHFSYFKEA